MNMVELEGQGLPATQVESQASVKNEPIILDPKKIYKLDGKEYKGDVVRQKVYRGEGYQQLQSENDKLKAELSQMQGDIQILLEEQEKNGRQAEMKTFFEKNLSSIKPTGDDGFNEDFNADPKSLDADKLADMIAKLRGEIQKDVTSTVTKTAEQQMREIFNNILQEQSQTSRAKEYVANLDVMTKNQLEVMYPNFSSLETSKPLFDKVISVKRQLRGLQVKMGELWDQQSPEFYEHQSHQVELESELGNIMGDIKLGERRESEIADARQVMGQGSMFTKTQETKLPKTAKEQKAFLESQEEQGRKRYDAWKKARESL